MRQGAADGENRSLSRKNMRIAAAALVAEDELPDTAIAAAVGIAPSTLYTWKNDAVFQEIVSRNLDRLEAEELRYPIAKLRNRMRRLNDRWERVHRLIDARADELADEVAGGDTGLLVRQTKFGPDGARITEYAADTALLREARELEKQAGLEARGWVEKREMTGKDGGPLEVSFTFGIISANRVGQLTDGDDDPTG